MAERNENGRPAEIAREIIKDHKKPFDQKVDNLEALLISMEVPNSQEIARRIVTVAEIPWFMPEANLDEESVRTRASETCERLAVLGDHSTEVEIIRDWDIALQRANAAKEFAHIVSYQDGKHHYLKALKVLYQGGEDGWEMKEFTSQGILNAWSQLNTYVESSQELKDSLQIVDEVTTTCLEAGRHRSNSVLDNFHDAYFDPAWQKESENRDDMDMNIYTGNFGPLLTYEGLLSHEVIAGFTGRVHVQPVETALLYTGSGLYSEDAKADIAEDPTEPLIALYQVGVWPIGLTRNNNGQAVFSVLIPPASVIRQIDRMKKAVKSLYGVDNCSIKSSMDNDRKVSRKIDIGVNPLNIEDHEIDVVMSNAKKVISKGNTLDGMGDIEISVTRQRRVVNQITPN